MESDLNSDLCTESDISFKSNFSSDISKSSLSMSDPFNHDYSSLSESIVVSSLLESESSSSFARK